MIDLHCHYLPGIDDGAQTLSDSLDLARAAVEAGIHTAVMTPHVHPGRYENSGPTIRKLCTAFQRVLEHQEIPLQIRAGGEVRISSDIIAMVEQDQIPFIGELAGYRIMLLEFPHSHLLIGADKLIKWLMARHIRPLIAHPERNKEVIRNVEKIAPFVHMGCLLQLTGASILGQFGKPAQQRALTIIERGWATVVATDAHNLRHRPPNLDLAYAALVDIGGESLARQLTDVTPGLVVYGSSGEAAARAAASAPAAAQPG
ncbi:MAG: Tyrosine-protein phosphatase YwqE [Betaproteobacteria bacterium]|nr:Tyrosine-protein phosphatase YwqE [Betaproteobacteria bacterium]